MGAGVLTSGLVTAATFVIRAGLLPRRRHEDSGEGGRDPRGPRRPPTLGPVCPGIPRAPSLPGRPWDKAGRASAHRGGPPGGRGDGAAPGGRVPAARAAGASHTTLVFLGLPPPPEPGLRSGRRGQTCCRTPHPPAAPAQKHSPFSQACPPAREGPARLGGPVRSQRAKGQCVSLSLRQKQSPVPRLSSQPPPPEPRPPAQRRPCGERRRGAHVPEDPCLPTRPSGLRCREGPRGTRLVRGTLAGEAAGGRGGGGGNYPGPRPGPPEGRHTLSPACRGRTSRWGKGSLFGPLPTFQ